MADLGWITGHTSVVYGPLCNGATSVLFESVATYPDCGMYSLSHAKPYTLECKSDSTYSESIFLLYFQGGTGRWLNG